MAKMLAGYDCAAQIDLTDGQLLRAALGVLRSDRFAFVGLVEFWDASICLLHRTLPGASRPLVAEFRSLGHSVNSHRAIGWMPPSDTDGFYNESVLEGFIDVVDEAIYAEAEIIFRHNLERAAAQDQRRRPRATPTLIPNRTKAKATS
jgi:hypothetical protein